MINQKHNYTYYNKNMDLPTNTKIISTLKESIEFDIIIKNGIKFNRELIAIYAMPLSHFYNYLHKKKKNTRIIKSCNILGFSINKKVAKACKRNLLKRRIKAIMYQLTLDKFLSEYALVFICRKGIAEIDFIDLKNQIIYGINKIKNNTNKNKFAQKRSNQKYIGNNTRKFSY